MPLEATVNRIPDLNSDWPLDGDLTSEGAAHLRNIKTAVTADNAALVGAVIAWHGLLANIPAGWALCDGANGTPDLRDRFVVGAGSTYALNDTGGANSVTLTLSEIPGHDHGGGGNTGSNGGHNHGGSTGANGGHNHGGSTGNTAPGTNTTGSHSHSGSTNTTGSHSHGFPTTSETGGGSSTGAIWNSLSNDNGRTTFSAGSHSHSLSINSNGSHSHTVSSHSHGISSVSNHSHSISTQASHTHTYDVLSEGGGGSHENRPPYYGLFWIKKISE